MNTATLRLHYPSKEVWLLSKAQPDAHAPKTRRKIYHFMAEESIAGGGSKQEMKRIKRKQRHLQSSQGLKKNSGRDII